MDPKKDGHVTRLVPCPVCQSDFHQRVNDGRPKTCSRSCARKRDHRNREYERNPRLHAAGYVKVFVGHDHPYSDKGGYILEHRRVMEREIGRHLVPGEYVHHKNGVRDDNRIENLELWSRKDPPGQRVADKAEVRRIADDLEAWYARGESGLHHLCISRKLPDEVKEYASVWYKRGHTEFDRLIQQLRELE